jgi:hypothetical protein
LALNRTGYHNIFLTYRSRSDKGIAEEEYSQAAERELEDNVTKALINVLEYARGPILAAFLEACGIKPKGPLETYEFALHEDSSKTEYPGKKKYLIEIGPGKEELRKGGEAEARTLNPIHDARITGNREVCFIEVKIRGTVSKEQRQSYLKTYHIAKENVIPLTWERIYDSFIGLLPRDSDIGEFWFSVGGFLLVQFLEFLEMLGLSAFSGIRSEHFNILGKEIEEITLDERAKLKWLQKTYSEAVKAEIDAIGNRKLIEATRFVHCGYIKPNEKIPYVSLSEEESAMKTQYPHFGSSLNYKLVNAYVSCEGKNAYSKFLNVCQTAPEEIVMALANLRGYTLTILKRKQVRVRQYKYDYDHPLEIMNCPPTVQDLKLLASEWDGWFASKEFYPGVFLQREIEKEMVIDQGVRLAREVAETIAAMRPYRDLIHDWRMRRV